MRFKLQNQALRKKIIFFFLNLSLHVESSIDQLYHDFGYTLYITSYQLTISAIWRERRGEKRERRIHVYQFY